MVLCNVGRRTSSNTNFHTSFYFILFFDCCVFINSCTAHAHGCARQLLIKNYDDDDDDDTETKDVN